MALGCPTRCPIRCWRRLGHWPGSGRPASTAARSGWSCCAPRARRRAPAGLDKSNRAKSRFAPVVAILAHDLEFWRRLNRLYPHADAAAWFRDDPRLARETAFRNGTLQAAYFVLALRALGLDVGAVSGFDADAINREFFAGNSLEVNFVCNVGYGDSAELKPRLPRLTFQEILHRPPPRVTDRRGGGATERRRQGWRTHAGCPPRSPSAASPRSRTCGALRIGASRRWSTCACRPRPTARWRPTPKATRRGRRPGLPPHPGRDPGDRPRPGRAAPRRDRGVGRAGVRPLRRRPAPARCPCWRQPTTPCAASGLRRRAAELGFLIVDERLATFVRERWNRGAGRSCRLSSVREGAAADRTCRLLRCTTNTAPCISWLLPVVVQCSKGAPSWPRPARSTRPSPGQRPRVQASQVRRRRPVRSADGQLAAAHEVQSIVLEAVQAIAKVQHGWVQENVAKVPGRCSSGKEPKQPQALLADVKTAAEKAGRRQAGHGPGRRRPAAGGRAGRQARPGEIRRVQGARRLAVWPRGVVARLAASRSGEGRVTAGLPQAAASPPARRPGAAEGTGSGTEG